MNNKIKMANEDTSNKNEMDRVAGSETNISTPSQDTDEDTNNAVVAITSNSAVDKCIPEPQASHTGITVNTSSQPSPPAFDPLNPLNSPQQPTCDDVSADIALVGRISSKVSENERYELRTGSCSPVEEVPLVQEETDTGASSKILVPHGNVPLKSKGSIVPGTKFTNSASAEHSETANKICDAVRQYYMKQFVDRWKKKTTQEPSTISVVAALLVERNDKFRVVVLTAGTKSKYECSYFLKKGDTDEAFWGLCDGHAEAMCYRLGGLYLVTEIYKLYDKQDSILEVSEEGYSLRKGVRFHLFTSHPPCGFMAKKERHFLSWKRPFVGKPHSLQCSSTILIGAYLGIQGPLSQWFVKPIYISSITMPRYKNVETLHDSYIQRKFEKFQEQSDFLNTQGGQYSFHPPHIEIVDIDPCTIFQECYRPYMDDEQSVKSYLIPEKVLSNKKECKIIAGAIPDVVQNSGIHALMFTVNSGIGSERFRKSVLELKYILVKLEYGLKKKRLELLQEAQKRLSLVLDIKLALSKLREILVAQVEAAYEIRQRKINKIDELLAQSKMQPKAKGELENLYDEVKTTLHKANEGNELSNIADALGENVTYQKMLDDLESLLEQGKHHSWDSEFYLNLMGCDLARYVETISKDVNCGIFDSSYN